MIIGELREAVLRLERVVEEKIVRRERFGPERRVRIAAREDVNQWKEGGELAAALILLGVARDQAVRDAVAEDRVPLADARVDVLENRVVGGLIVQEVVRERLP